MKWIREKLAEASLVEAAAAIMFVCAALLCVVMVMKVVAL